MTEFAKIIQSVILGIVEGLTEFLPVSSTGHLVIVQNLLNFDALFTGKEDFVTAYSYIIQLGAIFAIIILQRKAIINSFRNFMPQKTGFQKSGLRFWSNIVIACIPGAIVEFTLGDMVEDKFFNFVSIAVALIIGALVMIAADCLINKSRLKKILVNIDFKMAFIIGLFQCLAIFPGVSRSAATIVGGMVCGLTLVSSARFSFFLAIPVMFGMSVLKIIKLGFITGLNVYDYICLIIGFLVSFITAAFVVKLFLRILKKKSLIPFAIYRIILAGIVLLAGIFQII